MTRAAADRAGVGAADGQRGVEWRRRRCGSRILERGLEPGTEGRCPRIIVGAVSDGATGASGTAAVALLFSEARAWGGESRGAIAIIEGVGTTPGGTMVRRTMGGTAWGVEWEV